MPKSSIEVREFDTIELYGNKLVRADGTLDLIPDSLKYLDVRRSGVTMSVSAKGYVGLIPLTRDQAVLVRPRVPLASVSRLLGESAGSIGWLPKVARDYADEDELPAALFALQVDWFCAALNDVDRYGIWKEYHRTSKRTSTPSGRWDFARTMRASWSQAAFHNVVCDQFFLSSDGEFNQLLRYGIDQCIKTMRVLGLVESSRRIKQMQWIKQSLPEKESVPVEHVVEHVRMALNSGELPATREYYRPALDLSIRILESTGMAPEKRGTQRGLDSVIVNMPDLFETFVRNSFIRWVPTLSESKMRVVDGNKSGKRPFFSDRNTPVATPDVLIMDAEGAKLIVEVKYKPKISKEDRYQIVSYAVSYGVTNAVLILPSSGMASSVELLGQVGRHVLVMVYVYRVSLCTDQWDEVEHDMAEAVVGLSRGVGPKDDNGAVAARGVIQGPKSKGSQGC